MAGVVWIDPAPVDGTTALTAARWEMLKTNIQTVLGLGGGAGGNVDAFNIANGSISRTQMAVGNKDARFTFTINCNLDQLTSDIGQGAGQTVVYPGPTFPFAWTLREFHVQAVATTGATSTAWAYQDNGANYAASALAPVTSSPMRASVAPLTLAIAAGRTSGVQLVTAAGHEAQGASATIVGSANLV
jgi:hypothetical protein